jgi:hypothetical protein
MCISESIKGDMLPAWLLEGFESVTQLKYMCFRVCYILQEHLWHKDLIFSSLTLSCTFIISHFSFPCNSHSQGLKFHQKSAKAPYTPFSQPALGSASQTSQFVPTTATQT